MRKSVPNHVLEYLWRRAGGRCECRRSSHRHIHGKCGRRLARSGRGSRRNGGWEVLIRNPRKRLSPRNCMIFCHECYWDRTWTLW